MKVRFLKKNTYIIITIIIITYSAVSYISYVLYFDMILFQWFVVYFLNDSLQGADADYSVIPKSWLTVVDQKYFCKWPKTKKVTTNVLHKGENLPENTYNLFSVNLCFNGVPFGKY